MNDTHNTDEIAIDAANIDSYVVSETEEFVPYRVYSNGIFTDLTRKVLTTATRYSIPEDVSDVDTFKEYLRTILKMDGVQAIA